jgi:carboxypeptidase Q
MFPSRRAFLAAAGAAAAHTFLAPSRAFAAPEWLDPYRDPASRLIGAALADAAAWQRLAELTDTFGPRLSGSRALEDAIQWAIREMQRDGLEHVRAEPVMVPRWVRGRERLEITSPYPAGLVMLGLGNSVGTPPGGIEAELLVVSGFDELERRAGEAAGRIVLFNVPYVDYSTTVVYRTNGPSRAARAGAVAALVRSVGVDGLRTPHTGMLTYQGDARQIPGAAIPVEDATRLERMVARGSVRLRLTMEAAMHDDVESANVVGEIVGRERPAECVVVGGHLDSWDVGSGAIDDGGGCVVTWEAVRLMKALDLRPRRTVRVVLFTNEENGLRGGAAYRDRHAAELPGHVLMIESDGGVFRPRGFGFTGPIRAREAVTTIASLLAGIQADRIGPAGGGADIGPAVQAGQVPAMSLDVDTSQYFKYHHTEADTVDKLDPVDMARCVAAIAVMAYVVADLPQRLGDEVSTA